MGPKPKREKKEKEPKEPKKRGRKPLNASVSDDGVDPIDQIEKKPKRQYNRKKKAEPGTMCEDDLEKVEMPIDSMFPSAKNEASENGDIEDTPDAAPLADLDEEIQKKPLVRLKAKTPAKAKPSKTLLQFAKKKRKRSDSEGSDADLDRTPPPSPPEEESGIEKRRSGRNTKRKKYIDDVKYNFSDEDKKDGEEAPTIDDILGPDIPESTENSMGAEGEAGSGPNYAFIDPTAEDTMIVQFILASRTGTREEEEETQEKPPVEKVENGNPEEMKEEKDGEKQEEKDEVKDEAADEAKEPKKDSDKEAEKESEKEPESDKEEVKKEETEEIKDLKDIKDSEVKEKESPAKAKEEASPKKTSKPSKTVEVEEYLVKFKNFSYLHCQWLTEEELLRGDKRVSQKIKRYQQKKEKSAN